MATYSRYWRRNVSQHPSTELGLSLRALRKVAAHMSAPNVGVVFATYALIDAGSEGERRYTDYQTKLDTSWFVGFAPFGGAPAGRISFAVLVEHGGYGGAVAAPIAGQFVTAARDLKIIQ